MGFTINEKITTELSWQEITLITVAFGEYERLYKERMEEVQIKEMNSLVNRLGRELYNHPDNDKPNGY